MRHRHCAIYVTKLSMASLAARKCVLICVLKWSKPHIDQSDCSIFLQHMEMDENG